MRFTIFIITIFSFVRSANIFGFIIDANSKEPLVGANIVLLNSNFGSSTDLDGYFYISNVDEGLYTLQVSYIGYEGHIESSIDLDNNETLELNFGLKPSVIQGDLVRVIDKMKEGGNSSLLKNKRNAETINDGISSDDISRSGDSDAADAVKRIAGVSVTDGKFAVIRGLSNRYTSTTLNSISLPSPEPDKQTIPLDIFPTVLLSEIVAKKTYTADMPGSFAAGSINVKTKAYPNKKVFGVKLSFSEKNTLRNQRSFIKISNSNNFLGYTNIHNDYQKNVPNIVLNSSNVSNEDAGTYGKSLKNRFKIEESNYGTPISIGLNYGNKFNYNDWLEYGLFSNLAFSNSYSHKDSETAQYAQSNNSFDTYTNRFTEKSAYNTNLGYNLSLGLNILQKYKFKYQYLYSHNSSDEIKVSTGYTPNIQPGLFIKNNYTEKEISNHALSGNITYQDFNNMYLDWVISLGKSNRYEPDLKSHNYEYDEISNSYKIDTQAGKVGYRSFAWGFDKNDVAEANLKYNLNINNSIIAIKTGIFSQNKDRTFKKREFHISYSSLDWWNNDADQNLDYSEVGNIFNDTQYCYYDTEQDSLHHGLVLYDEEANNATNAYDAKEKTSSKYIMFSTSIIEKSDFKLSLSSGLRNEEYKIYLKAYNPITNITASGLPVGDLGEDISSRKILINKLYNDFLPYSNLSFDFKSSHKVRVAYSKTLNRPQLRELAPLAYQEFYQGKVVIGFPYLKPAYVNNYDIRYEVYLSPTEIISMGLFSKKFNNAIETSLISTPDLIYQTPQNISKANTKGLEIEIRKKINFLPESFGRLLFSGNISLSESNVKSDSIVYLANGTEYSNAAITDSRPMQGHSKLLINSSLNLKLKNNYSFSIAYNTFSRRIHAIGIGGLGDEYEFPFQSLNFTANKKVGGIKISLKVKNILNDEVNFGLINDQTGKEYITKSFNPGYSLSLGINYNLK